jgi:metal-responsive CopG/Arc/MetJ family transcriptional regulator
MRTIVDIPQETLTRLDAWAGREKVSRAEMVRRVLAGAVKQQDEEQDSHGLDELAGVWKGRHADGMTYQRAIRADWKD